MTHPFDFSDTILAWYEAHGRKHLPWQQDITPYRVWVSEIMLQQTQVTTVIPYYQRFMQRFPTVHQLAAASQDDVLHLWTGLGYYARGRNLHAAAQHIVTQWQGNFPRSIDQLTELPGIGRSTAGAIASISMGMRAPILDGNVKRVLTRFFAIEGWPGISAINQQLWDIAEALTPDHSHQQYTQAMMDMGATVCTRSKPACGLCPLQPQCQGYASGQPVQYPHRKPKKEKPEKTTYLLMLEHPNGSQLLQQRPQSGIWGGLWSFPETQDPQQAAILAEHIVGMHVTDIEFLPSFRHTFSHYHLHIHPIRLRIPTTSSLHEQPAGYQWYDPQQPSSLGLAAPVKALLHSR
ncbi:MAG: A/G-specific adenine glycosylase [Bacterioplanes sp.]|nr:A/G-specific adenine glycosylase [Bacterioplanes sp.]